VRFAIPNGRCRYSVHLINNMKRFLISNKLKSNDITENVSSVLDRSKIDFPCTSTTVVESIKPDSKQTNSNELFKLNVPDLSSTCDKSAVQPVINFPRTVISGKHRCFQSSWYSKYPWLEYSITLNAVFCYYVVIFLLAKRFLSFILKKML